MACTDMETLKVKTGKCPDEVLQAIYGPKSPQKSANLEASMERWWRVYSSRKMSDPTEEYTANSLVYDPNHLPNSPRKAGTDTAPAQ